MDALIRFIERLIQGIVSIIQPLVESGDLGYLIPFVLLLAATFVALTAKNRINLIGYILGWIISISLIGLYQESNGDSLLVKITGNAPRSDLIMPIGLGIVVGVILLLPFSRGRLADVQPLLIAIVTGISVMLLFLTWRASVSIPSIQSAGEENLILYRKRFVGVFALAFGIGVLVHVLISASRQRPPPKS